MSIDRAQARYDRLMEHLAEREEEPKIRGECICCGVQQEGVPARSRPDPYRASLDPFGGGRRVMVQLIVSERGVHEVPLRRLPPSARLTPEG